MPDQPPVQTPPAGTPPAANPPASTPPVGDPAASLSTPPVPPAENPPAEPPKPAEGDPAAKKDEKKDGEKPKEGAPEKYAEFKMPEGAKLDPADFDAFTAMARADNLSQEQAQKYLDLASARMAQMHQNQSQAWQNRVEGWRQETISDPEIGGANFKTNQEHVLRAVNKFGVPGLTELLNSGVGNNPALFKTFLNIGKAMAESSLKDGSPSVDDLTPAQVLYGKPKQ